MVAATQEWIRDKIDATHTICVYNQKRDRDSKNSHDTSDSDCNNLPILLLSIIIIVIFLLGIYLYSQLVECRMQKSVSKYCAAGDGGNRDKCDAVHL